MVVTISNFKGGVSKSTTAIHISGVLAQKKSEKVLLIDLDDNESSLEWAENGLLPFDVLNERQARGEIANYEHVVIDTRGRPSPKQLEQLVGVSDLNILPSFVDALSIRALLKTIDFLGEKSKTPYRVLLTAVPPNPSKEGERILSALDGASIPTFKNSIRRSSAFKRAAEAGILVKDVKGHQRALDCWQDYKDVVKELRKHV